MGPTDTDHSASASRVWSMEHQKAFAQATGDVNPMHMDLLVARRTLAGAAAVHGVHAALWALDVCAASRSFADLAKLQMRFERFVLVGDRTEIAIQESDARRLRLSVNVNGLRALTIQAEFALDRPPRQVMDFPESAIPEHPIAVEPATISGLAGAFRIRVEHAAALAPRLAEAVGAERVAALGSLSTLVGMVVPGLHSILSKIDVTLTEELGTPHLVYAVRRFQPTLQSVSAQASGPGIAARIDSFVRPHIVEQELLQDLAVLVRPDEFIRISALIIGGSRGLGATTAKLLAAGGGDVCITYATGADDAAAVAAEIHAAGGRCQVLRFDARDEAEAQLGSIAIKPVQLYHFATPRIFRQKRSLFERDVFDEMMRVYNYAFHDLCMFCLARGAKLDAFYPSTVAIDEAARDTLEYVMAKTAGEMMATTLARNVPDLTVHIERLPRIRTDQTATIFPVPAAPPSAFMLPAIRKLSIS